MSDNDENFEMAKGAPANASQYVVAEGESEFRAKPEDFMNLIGGEPALPKVPGEQIQEQSYTQNNEQSDISAMKDILERFHDDATYAVEKANRDPETKREVTKAVLSETYSGKEWQIRLDEDDNSGYMVFNSNAKKSFYSDLALQETARALVRVLEGNVPLNSKKVNEILYYDNVYKKYASEAKNFKRLHKKAKMEGNGSRMNILADKFENARGRALDAKSKIKKM